MKATKTISPLQVVPAPAAQAPVKPLLTEEDKQFLDLLAQILLRDLTRQAQELQNQNQPKS